MPLGGGRTVGGTPIQTQPIRACRHPGVADVPPELHAPLAGGVEHHRHRADGAGRGQRNAARPRGLPALPHQQHHPLAPRAASEQRSAGDLWWQGCVIGVQMRARLDPPQDLRVVPNPQRQSPGQPTGYGDGVCTLARAYPHSSAPASSAALRKIEASFMGAEVL